MIQLDEVKQQINALLSELNELSQALNLESKKLKIDELEQKQQTNFWDDSEI